MSRIIHLVLFNSSKRKMFCDQVLGEVGHILKMRVREIERERERKRERERERKRKRKRENVFSEKCNSLFHSFVNFGMHIHN